MSVSDRTTTEPPARELREIANDVRRIGDGYRQNPETICLQKDNIAHRLLELAQKLERAA